MAARHAERLRVLAPALLTVHHIGSTSVPGLAAKPILDLLPAVRDLAELDQARALIEALGYAWHGDYGIPGRRYCTLSDTVGGRLVQLHCFQAASPHVTRHLAFRDYLRAHPNVARGYAVEKRRARDLHPGDSHAYGAEKSAWIEQTETAALAWYARPSLGTQASP